MQKYVLLFVGGCMFGSFSDLKMCMCTLFVKYIKLYLNNEITNIKLFLINNWSRF